MAHPTHLLRTRGTLIALGVVVIGTISGLVAALPHGAKPTVQITRPSVAALPAPVKVSPTPVPIPPNNYGFSANELVWKTPQLRARQLEGMKAAGVSWVRLDVQWYVVQPTSADTFDWTVYDRAIEDMYQQGFQVLAILDYAPGWAAAPGCKSGIRHKCAPVNLPAFATFAAAATTRYSPRGVTNWEIWNEPNSPRFWYPKVSPATYAELLKVTYPAIKQADPNATVITGGLASTVAQGGIDPPSYVASLYAAGAQPFFDGLGTHPYSFPTLPSAPQLTGWTQMIKIHDIAVAQGDTAKKVWLTEVGATTGGPHPVREDIQARIAQEAVQLHKTYPWAGPLFWYDYQDLGTNRQVAENFYGLLRANGARKPAYAAFTRAINPATDLAE